MSQFLNVKQQITFWFWCTFSIALLTSAILTSPSAEVSLSPKFLWLVYFFCSPLHVCLSKSYVFFFLLPVTVAFVLNCGEFCVYFCNLLLQLEEWCASLLCSPCTTSPSSSLPVRFFSIDALTVKCSLCLYCWPHQLGQSLMTHYTHINRTKHKQSLQSSSMHLHISRVARLSETSIFAFLFHPPPFFFCLYSPVSCLPNTHMVWIHA